MQRVDIVIVALVIIALGGSILGVMFYEPPGDPRWDLSFTTSGASEEAASFDVPGERAWPLAQVNITRVEFNLVITGQAQVPARLEEITVTVRITPPTGETRPATLTLPAASSATTDTDRLTFVVHETPQDELVEARNATLALPEPGRDGTGEWKIEAQRSGGSALQPETVRLTVEASYRYYVGDVSRHFPDIGQAA